MKKYISIAFVAIIMAVSSWIINQKNSKTSLSGLALSNIDALAQWEWGTGEEVGKIAVTEKCQYKYPDGSFTTSVRRACYDQYVCPTCTCTPVPCGDVFYN